MQVTIQPEYFIISADKDVKADPEALALVVLVVVNWLITQLIISKRKFVKIIG
jgi:hypothetical protein